MIKKFNGPGGYYIKDSDVGPDPFSKKILENPFNCEQFYKESWNKPEMRSDYRELNFAYESLSPKEFAGGGEQYADAMYKLESGETERKNPFEQPKNGSERENFGSGKESMSQKEEKGSRKKRGFE